MKKILKYCVTLAMLLVTVLSMTLFSCDSETHPQENEYRYKDIIFEEFDPLGITKAPCILDTIDVSSLKLDSIYFYHEIYAYFNGDLSPQNITSSLGDNYSEYIINYLGEFEFGINYKKEKNHRWLNDIIAHIPYCKIQYHEWNIINPYLYIAVFYIENNDSLFPVFAVLFNRYISVYDDEEYT